MLDRVLEQISEELQQKFAVAADAEVVGNGEQERLALLFRTRSIKLRDRAEQFVHVDGCKSRPTGTALDLRDAQERPENAQNDVYFADRPCDCLAQFRRIRFRALDSLQPLPEPAQWRSQVMRDVGSHLLQLAHQRFYAVQ